MVAALAGGVRAAAANGCWLLSHRAWQRRDEARTIGFLERALWLDPRSERFWVNGARIVACDVAAWRCDPAMPAAARARVEEEQAGRALDLLRRGLALRGPDSAFYLEMAAIHLHRRHDPARAAACFRRAAECPGAPYVAARLHAELLRSLGRRAEALTWLRRVLPSLPAGDPAARREVVRARIAELERELEPRDREEDTIRAMIFDSGGRTDWDRRPAR